MDVFRAHAARATQKHHSWVNKQVRAKRARSPTPAKKQPVPARAKRVRMDKVKPAAICAPGAYQDPKCPTNVSTHKRHAKTHTLHQWLLSKRVYGPVERFVDNTPKQVTHLSLRGGKYDIFAGCGPSQDARAARVAEFRAALIKDARNGEYHTLCEQFSPRLARIAIDLDIAVAANKPFTRKDAHFLALAARQPLHNMFPTKVDQARAALSSIRQQLASVKKGRPQTEEAYRAIKSTWEDTLYKSPLWVVLTRSPEKQLGGATPMVQYSFHIHVPAVVDRNEQCVFVHMYNDQLTRMFDGEHGVPMRNTTGWVDECTIGSNGLRMLWNTKAEQCQVCQRMLANAGPDMEAAARTPAVTSSRRKADHPIRRYGESVCMEPECHNRRRLCNRVNGLYLVLHPRDDKDEFSRITFLREHPLRALALTSIRAPVYGTRMNPDAGTDDTALVLPKYIRTRIKWIAYNKPAKTPGDAMRQALDGTMSLKERKKTQNKIFHNLKRAMMPALKHAAVTFQSLQHLLTDQGYAPAKLSSDDKSHLLQFLPVHPKSSRRKIILSIIRKFRANMIRHGSMATITPYSHVRLDDVLFMPILSLYVVSVLGEGSMYCSNRGKAHSLGAPIYFVITPQYVLQHCEAWGSQKGVCKYHGVVTGGPPCGAWPIRPCAAVSQQLSPDQKQPVNHVDEYARTHLFYVKEQGDIRGMSASVARSVHEYGTAHNARLIVALKAIQSDAYHGRLPDESLDAASPDASVAAVSVTRSRSSNWDSLTSGSFSELCDMVGSAFPSSKISEDLLLMSG